MSCEFRHHDGAYVLGALSPAQRQGFEQHLAQCPECAESVRRLAGLPGLLARVPVEVLDPPPDEQPVPDTLLPSLLREVRRTRRRRRLLVTGLAAAAVVVGVLLLVGGGGLPWTGHPAPASVTAAPVAAAPRADNRMTAIDQQEVAGWVGFQTVPWGTKVALVCTYAPLGRDYPGSRPATYSLVVRTRDGRAQQVATWRALPGRTMKIAAATALSQDDIAAFEVRTSDGRPVLQWSM